MVNRFLKKNKLSKYFIERYREWERSRATAVFVKSMETYIQDSNAGNGGDRLKHALLMEVLIRINLGEWSYRETHAGAGLYPMNGHSRMLLKAIF